ncbi:hypothetical protein [Acidithiobacillus sp.]|uniref:hypothetical protein n=1 Tax=Acidithiobacillus sp. TaxID=1872118 RepID=UPI00261EA9D4|nr:hypothetical protein [Acidithiobacillus sp.]MDD5278666.1 hypothetical protein [Acidithiobacillus sp.]
MLHSDRYEAITSEIENAVFPSQLYRYVRSIYPTNGNKLDNEEARLRIKQIRMDIFSEAVRDLGINEEAALKIIGYAIERKYAALGRKVTADLKKTMIAGRTEIVFGVIEMFVDTQGNEDVRVIDIPLIPSAKEISEAIYSTMKGSWWSALAEVKAKRKGLVLLRIIDSVHEMNGEFAVMPYSELAYEDDYEGIEEGQPALVAIAENPQLESWELSGKAIKPRLFASRAIDRFPAIVGPRLGIIGNGYTCSGLAIYEIDPKEQEDKSLSTLIRSAEQNATILGVERLVFIHKTRTTYADTLVRRLARDIAGVSLVRDPIIIDKEKGKKRIAKIHVPFGKGKIMSGKHGRNLKAICRSAWIDSLEVVEVAK